jgi:hypothetical protein
MFATGFSPIPRGSALQSERFGIMSEGLNYIEEVAHKLAPRKGMLEWKFLLAGGKGLCEAEPRGLGQSPSRTRPTLG